MLTLAIVLGVACVMLLIMLFFAKSFVAWTPSTVISVFLNYIHQTYDMFINSSLLERDGRTNTTISLERTMVSFKSCIFAV